jgi:hypothetical protein
MASAAQFGRTKARKAKSKKARLALMKIPSKPGRQTGREIDPKLRAFIDRVVAPILVRDFLAHRQSEKEIAVGAGDMSSFTTASEVHP